ncbi:MAG: Dabb family protein [Actinomycetes bacterium]
MIRHIVVFKLKAIEENAIETDFQNIKGKLEALTVAHEGISRLDVYRGMGLVDFHWEVVLVGDYNSQEALDAYQVHPLHQEFVTWVSDYITDRVVIDFVV